MKIVHKTKYVIAVFLVILLQLIFLSPHVAHAATSPAISALTTFSVLGGQEVTCIGATTTTGAVGVSSGTSLTGFPSPCTAGGGTQNNNAAAIAAQAENLATFTALDQTCDQTFGAVDLTATFPSGVGPGVYCSTSSFSLSGNLNLTGSGVWIFKTVSTLITSPGSSITGGDACNVWWRVGSSATLDTTTSFMGNILALNGVSAMNAGATLNGRILAQDAGTVTLSANTITGPTCAAAASSSSSSISPSSVPADSGGSSSDSGGSSVVCPAFNPVTPVIIESRQVDPDSIFVSWGPFSGVNTFVVQYGMSNGNWQYSANVTGFSTTINDLPANQPIWIRIAATDNCTIGGYGEAVLVGGETTVIAGGPRLPNTGIGSRSGGDTAILGILMLGTLLLSPFLLKRVRD